MKKLKIKVFFTIFSILSLFIILILLTSITKNYFERKNSISRILNTMPNMYRENKELFIPNQERKIYMDFTIYTIVLDNNGNYKELINNTNNEEIDSDYIKKIAENIINNYKEKTFIGNLYFDKYSYSFTKNNTLIIVDNTNLNSNLINQLINSICLFMIIEIIIFVITTLITKWIIIPVNKTFEKQKIFVADASHELKTPLSVITASCDAYFNDKNDKWINNIKNESERMIKLVTNLLDLAKTEIEQEFIMQDNNLSEIIESCILTYESLFYENKIKLKYEIEPNINLLCNEDLILELMSILIDNAIKHCEEKGNVIIRLHKNNKQINLEIKNTGLPIKKEDEEKIFERFYKLDSSRNRNSNNYGLGLAIAKNIVIQHKGNISAHSKDGYTIFKIIF